MELIHDRLLNNQFAPGIATYGIDGKDGIAGPAGTSIYFTSYSLEDKEQQDKAIVKINRNMVLSEFADLALEREYAIGDLILDAVGRIYKIVKINNQFAIEYVTHVIGIGDNEYFRTSGNNRLYLTSSYVTQDILGNDVTNYVNGLDIVQGSESNQFEGGTSDYIMRVINTKEDTKTGMFNILQLLTKPVLGDEKTLNIYYDKTNDAFTIASDSNIFIDSENVEVQQSAGDAVSLGDYYKIRPYDDPIGLVHKMLSGATWTYSGDTLSVIGIDMSPIISLGLTNRFTVKYWNGTDYVFKEGLTVSSVGTLTVTGVSSKPSRVSVIRGIEVHISEN